MTRTEPSGVEGQVTVTPHLIVKGAAEAIEFYARAFGALEAFRMPCPKTGLLMHAELRIGEGKIFLCDEFPGMPCRGPESLGGSAVTFHLQVEDADPVYDRAVEAGATVAMPLADMFWGDRYGQVVDPFGHRWSIASKVSSPTPEEISAGAEAACA